MERNETVIPPRNPISQPAPGHVALFGVKCCRAQPIWQARMVVLRKARSRDEYYEADRFLDIPGRSDAWIPRRGAGYLRFGQDQPRHRQGAQIPMQAKVLLAGAWSGGQYTNLARA